jgi:DNA-binding winged helix-turn-helix (wHTH) protein
MPLRLGPFTLDLDQRRLLAADGEIFLAPKSFELLKFLIEQRPKALSKDEILREIWKNTFVTESNLATTVRDLREALGDSARDPRFIRTSYKYGYAFVGDVLSGQADAHTPSAWRILHDHREILLHDGENVLGRSGPGVIVIDSATVSRNHARLTIEGDRLSCQDLASKNGTWVGSRPATVRLEVDAGDELRLGSVVLVVRRQARRHGNPRTDVDLAWSPFLTTPPHPQYPAAHGAVQGQRRGS